MSLFNKPTSDLTVVDLNALIDNQIPESKTLDYKQALDLNSDKHKDKFVSDIAAFANTYGGLLLIGIKEEKGAPIEISGFECANIDQLKLQIQSVLSSKLEPVFNLYSISHIDIAHGKMVLIIDVKKSWYGPHRLTSKKSGFYYRLDGQNDQMDYYQVKEAMLYQDRIRHDIKKFIEERVSLISFDKGPFNIRKGPKVVLHIVPFDSFYQEQTVDILSYKNTFDLTVPLSSSGGGDNYINADGLVTTNSNPNDVYSYMLLFSNAVIEAVDTQIANRERRIITFAIGEKLVNAALRYFKLLLKGTILGPVHLELNILGAKGYTIAFPQALGFPENRPLDRSRLSINTILEKIPENKAAVQVALEPIFKQFFYAFGNSNNYFSVD